MPRHTTRTAAKRTLTRKPTALRVEPLEDRVVPQAYLVTSPGNDFVADGKITLAEAIVAASTNSKVGDAAAGSATQTDTILFLLGSGTQTISLSKSLPQLIDISGPLVIDGPDAASGNAVVIDGTDTVTDGLIVGGKSTLTVQDLTLGNFTNAAIRVSGGGSATVERCYIGTDKNGSNTLSNAGYGVLLNAAQNSTIGGTSVAARNVIANNTKAGVRIEGIGTSGNEVAGNYIGTRPNGTTALPNGIGVEITNGATNNRVGVPVAGGGNVIAGNSVVAGVVISGSGTDFNQVVGNRIGLDAAGNELPNANGVIIRGGASSNVVGGSNAVQRNFIGGNTLNGIFVADAGTTSNSIFGNFIGTDPSGTAARPNGFGVVMNTGATKTLVGGPSGTGFGNLISGNDFNGVFLNQTTDNTIAGNLIGTNAAGTLALPNADGGVYILASSNNTIGGSTAGLGNVISGNGKYGVEITDDGTTGTTGNRIEGNLIGTTKTGTAKLPNELGGVRITNGATNNTIGGLTSTPGTGAGNVISGNEENGVRIEDASNNQVWGNRIGLGSDGQSLGNGFAGVLLAGGASDTNIGGANSQQRNVIGGNVSAGVLVAGSDATGNVIAGNYIGTDPTGTAARPNGHGVLIQDGATKTLVGGPSGSGFGNLISGNTFVGVVITGIGTAENTVAGNLIGTNAAGTAALPNGANGVTISQGSNNTVGGSTAGLGNVISGNAKYGVEIIFPSSNGNRIEGNFIGTTKAGTAKLANGLGGVQITNGAINNTIGGLTSTPGTGAGNVISGNDGDGVRLVDGANNNQVWGNLIGLGSDGKSLGNFSRGVYLDGAPANEVGGTDKQQRNVIGGNDDIGVLLVGSATTDNLVRGNYVGVSIDGTEARPNRVGVGITAKNNVIGGPGDARNVISGNEAQGVVFSGDGATGNTVAGNYIGLAADGTTALGNGSDGVGIINGASGNTVGGTAPGLGNRIAYNATQGVQVSTANNRVPLGNRILGNSIYANGKLGIDLGGDGVTANDATDADDGPNRFQNFPVLASVSGSDTATSVSGSLASVANTTFRIEFFANSQLDASGHGEGETYLGSVEVTTDGAGNATITATTLAALPTDTASVTATATNLTTNDTSEFSQFVLLNTPPEFLLVPPDQTLSEGQSSGPLPVTIGDAETSPADLVLSATSSNPDLFPTDSIVLDGSGPDRTITLTPADGQTGTATITLTLEDEAGTTTTAEFDVTVQAVDNTPPTITDITDRTIPIGGSSGPIPFTVDDAESPPTDLVVTAATSDSTLFPSGRIVLDGTGPDRTITLTPADGETGTATVTITVEDPDGGTSTETFDVTVGMVDPNNTPPTITDVTDRAALLGEPIGPIPFTVGDEESSPSDLIVTASSSNSTLAPSSGIVLDGTGTDRTVTVTPAAGQFGTATITLTVTDPDGGTATDTFTVTVLPVGVAPPGLQRFTVGAGAGGAPTVTHYTGSGSSVWSLTPFESSFTGGVRVATADFNADGEADVAVGTGPGRATRVIVYDGVTKAVLFSIDPFESSFTGGVFVAAGDVNGDGYADLVITPDEGGGPRVRIFSGKGFGQIADFFGIEDPNFRGGARASVADVTGDGVADLLVAAGFGGGPRLAVFDGMSLGGTPTKPFGDFFVFEDTLRNGVFVAGGDLDGDGYAEVIAGGGPGGGPRLFALSGQGLMSGRQEVRANFFAGDTNNRGGVRIAARDLDGDGHADLVAGSGTGAGSRVTGYSGQGTTANGTPPELFAFDALPGFAGGVFVG